MALPEWLQRQGETVCKAMSIAAKVTVRVVSFGLLQDKFVIKKHLPKNNLGGDKHQ